MVANQVFPIVQSYKFKSKSQQRGNPVTIPLGVPDSSKLQIQKQITTGYVQAGTVTRCSR